MFFSYYIRGRGTLFILFMALLLRELYPFTTEDPDLDPDLDPALDPALDSDLDSALDSPLS